MSEWISTKDRLPEKDGLYLVACHKFSFFESKWGEKEYDLLPFLSTFREWNTKAAISVTHWMELPELPEEQNDDMR